MYRVVKTFRDKYTKLIYQKGDSYSHDDEGRITSLIDKGFIEESEKEIKHVGGGYYELPNGERVRGKKEALAALESGE